MPKADASIKTDAAIKLNYVNVIMCRSVSSFNSIHAMSVFLLFVAYRRTIILTLANKQLCSAFIIFEFFSRKYKEEFPININNTK